ncbi:MAG: TonB-dependent receptor [Bacteroidetes bacterium]|nr:MAG: TonB-dependent receptor [Bacteroidota bacterium]
MRKLLSLAALLYSGLLMAQNISGRVLQADNRAPIGDAHIQVMDAKTGKTLASSVSNDRGYFSFANPGTGDLLVVSHVSYQEWRKAFHKDSVSNLEIVLQPLTQVTDETVVRSTRANEKQATTFTEISKQEIARNNMGQDMPYLLNSIPGAVVNSDAGAGIGYTGIRIRGVDPTRINVTINGIPVNDAESHGVWWVNMPDFANSVQNIQVQRGVGTSTNGAAAFGASINLQTNAVRKESFATLQTGLGAIQNNWTSSPAWYWERGQDKNWNFGTYRNSVNFGTGLMANKWAFEGRLSQIHSDGFIDRASSDLNSWYFSGGHYGEKSILKFNVFSGSELTYQAWNGIPEPKVKGDEQALIPYYMLDDSAHLAQSGNRTYNGYTYNNEVDNYRQTHYQVHYTRQLNSLWSVNASLHYTRGGGYYEQYKYGESLSDYGLEDVTTAAGDTIRESDLIRRRWLDNHFYGIVYSAQYRASDWTVILGGGSNIYQGKHYGEVIWARYASNGEIRHRYYDNDARKLDHNVYVKTEYAISKKWNAYADLQVRSIDYSFLGFDNNQNNVTQDVNFLFFNPKFGVVYSINKEQNLYLSMSKGSREPTRDDFTQSTPASRPKPETLLDWELGYRCETPKQRIQATAYFMDYTNQLILTGKINDVGAYTRVNVPKSFRSGVELEYSRNLHKRVQWSATAALSMNQVKEFTEYIDNWDTWAQESVQHQNTQLAFSPNAVLSSMFRFRLPFNLELDWVSKYVSTQYLDNTQAAGFLSEGNAARQLDAFWVNDLKLHLIKQKWSGMKEFKVSLAANNVLNEKYAPNGYSFSGIIGGERQDFNYLYPQAGTNFLLMVSLGF